ncbi:MAG: 2OG-Fe(II) oxygenase [Alphaproteobacteria bacterium]
MDCFDWDRLQTGNVQHEPFDYMVVRNVVRAAALKDIRKDFPSISKPGLFPLSEVTAGPAFNSFVEEIQYGELTAMLGRKFDMDLSERPQMITVRGRCRARDGKIHTDTFEKILTVLIYLNDEWTAGGGNLRILRGPHDIDDVIAEVPPNGGTMIAFKPSPRSWHGHKPFEGERRYVMVNWMKNADVAAREILRHRVSAAAKRIFTT